MSPEFSPSPELEPLARPVSPPSEPAVAPEKETVPSETPTEVAESPVLTGPEDDRADGEWPRDAEHEASEARELLRLEIIKTFPELNTETGIKVVEPLVELLENEKISLAELKLIMPGGFRLEEQDKDLPEAYQAKDPKSRKHKYIAAAWPQYGTLHIFPEFLNDEIYATQRAHILGHEIGELMQRRLVEREPQGDASKPKEPLVDRDAYALLVAGRPAEWNGAYVAGQYGNEHQTSEMLADDIGDYLNAKSPEDMLKRRLRRAVNGETLASQVDQVLAANADTDMAGLEVAQAMIEEARAVHDFLTTQLGDKRSLLKEVPRQNAEGDEADDLVETGWMLGPADPVGLPNTSVDMTVAKKFFDALFGVKT
jgi:hypothetical protein